jgi:hypothetical protein
MATRREGGLLAWQWSIYREGHRNRRTLFVHALTVPVFLLGNCAVGAAPFTRAWLAVGGAAAMTAALALQGWVHRREVTPPAPFTGPLDVVGRIFVEQWITFPRFVLSGGLVAAWRQATQSPARTNR